jgi:hypothetical protein
VSAVRTTALFLVTVLLCGRAAADPQTEDDDLGRLPTESTESTAPTAQRAVAPTAPALETKIYLDDALTLGMRRDVDVPVPGTPPYDRQNRTSLDLSSTWSPRRGVKLVLSDRVDVIEQEATAWWSQQTIRNALREAYASWEPITRGYLEVGRINVRNGSALGFNPTDFLRAGTFVGQASLDPSVLRVNRLGTVMVRAQAIGDGWSASALYAPELVTPTSFTAVELGIDPRLDATNATNRALAEVSTDVGDVSAQALVYLAPHRSKIGVDLTRPIGTSVVAYLEWAGGFEQGLIARALDDGRATGGLPADAPPPFPIETSRSFHNDLSAGASWTIAGEVTVNGEYHLHQSGMSGSEWDSWFSTGMRAPALAGELWYVRGYANDQLEPVARQEVFVRADWPKAFVDHLELTGFAFVDLDDGSVLSQVSGSYYISDAWTATFSLGGSLGSRRSERGSIPQELSGIVELVRYL